MMGWSDHLLVAPIALPLVAGALMLFFDDPRRSIRAGVGIAATVANLGLSAALLLSVDASADLTKAYLLGNWPAPFGIVLALDRLSALVLVTCPLNRRCRAGTGEQGVGRTTAGPAGMEPIRQG